MKRASAYRMRIKTTGYALREAIKSHELLRDTAHGQFAGSLKAFPGEEKVTPQQVVETFLREESAVVALQVAQAAYNLANLVLVQGEMMPLAQAIKAVGGHARAEKLWRGAAGPKKDRYGGLETVEDTRDPTKLLAVLRLGPDEAARLASVEAKRASALRAVIGVANATEIEIDLDPALLG